MGHIAGIAIAVEGWAGYFPIYHESGGNLDKKLVYSWLQEIFNQTDTTFIFHNAMYDVCWLRTEGLIVKGKIVDTMIAASLIDENRLSYQLNTLSRHYIGMGKDEKYLKCSCKRIWIRSKKRYVEITCFICRSIRRERRRGQHLNLEKLETELYKEELWDVFNLETKLFPCLVDMRFKGVRVDLGKADKIKKNLMQREAKIVSKNQDFNRS